MRACPAILCFSLSAILPAAAAAQTIVWTDTNARTIQKKDVSGVEIETIVQFPPGPAATQIHCDPLTAKLYYRHGTGFQRSNLDGSQTEDIATPSAGTFTLNVDLRKLYWFTSSSDNVLNRSELNGSGVVSHSYPTGSLKTLEAFGEQLFFGAGGVMAKGVWQADPDGANEQFIHGSPEPWDLAHDPVDNKLYLAAEAIYRMNLDGTGFEQVVFLPAWQLGNSFPTDVEVDSRNRKVYWADEFARVIQRANLDGSNVEDFVTAAGTGNPDFDIRGLTIVYSSTPVPTLSGCGAVTVAATLLSAGLLVLRKRSGSLVFPRFSPGRLRGRPASATVVARSPVRSRSPRSLRGSP